MGLTGQDPGCCCVGGHGSCPGSPDPGYCCCPGTSFPLPTQLFFTVCGQTFALTGNCATVWQTSLVGFGVVLNTPGVANATGPACNLGTPHLVNGTIDSFNVQVNCPVNSTTMTANVGGNVINYPGIPFEALCPTGCDTQSTVFSDSTVNFNLTGTITPTSISLTGTIPATLSSSGVAAPCAGQPCTLTN